MEDDLLSAEMLVYSRNRQEWHQARDISIHGGQVQDDMTESKR